MYRAPPWSPGLLAPVEVSNLRPGFFIGAKVEAGLDADELSEMELPIVIAVVCFGIGFGVGYAVREQKSSMRRRWYYHRDSIES